MPSFGPLSNVRLRNQYWNLKDARKSLIHARVAADLLGLWESSLIAYSRNCAASVEELDGCTEILSNPARS